MLGVWQANLGPRQALMSQRISQWRVSLPAFPGDAIDRRAALGWEHYIVRGRDAPLDVSGNAFCNLHPPGLF